MKDQYRRVFKEARLSDMRREEIRTALSTRLTETTKEVSIMHSKSRKFRIHALAAAIIAAILLVGFTVGPQVVRLLSGGTLTSEKHFDGSGSTSLDVGFRQDPAEVRDGRIYFILDGSDLDITDQCSEGTYFQYEIDEDGTRQVVLVGGTPERLGFALYVWLEDGSSASTYDLPGPGTPAWVVAADAAFGR